MKKQLVAKMRKQEVELVKVSLKEIVKESLKLLIDEMSKDLLSRYDIKTTNERTLSCVILDGITDAWEHDKWKLQAMATLKGLNIEHDGRFEEAEQICDKILKTKRGQKFFKELNFMS